MTLRWENSYLNIAKDILLNGIDTRSRNGTRRRTFAQTLEIDCLNDGYMPVLTTRKIGYMQSVGEFCAFLHAPITNVKQFNTFGCTFWDRWADKEGNINIDYGFTREQLRPIINTLQHGPHGDSRLIVNNWRNGNIKELTIPCCHYNYQFFSRGDSVDLLWYQRSADWMVGVPHDIIVASLLLINVASDAHMKPGKLKMIFADAHIYGNQIDTAKEQLQRLPLIPPSYKFDAREHMWDFVPEDFHINNYEHHGHMGYEVSL